MLLRDVRYIFRKRRRQPVETAALILTLAIGIGLPATIATLAYSVGWGARPGVDDPDALAWVVHTDKRSPGRALGLSYPEYLALQERGGDLFDGVTGQMRTRARLEFGGDVRLEYGDVVAGRHFEVLGARPALGRFLSADMERAEVSLALMLGGWSAQWLQLYILPDANQAMVLTAQTWVFAFLGVAGVFVLSILGPTRRALGIHPASSLRGDSG